jgi:Predicted soluble lytic transglycosylase fused to an ABC-type amino acid-binding protein
LQEKYQAFIPKNQNRQQTSNLIKGLERELVQYHAAINSAAREYNLDPLFLTAIMYQESHFQNTNGNSGQGLMQLTQSTAASLGVNPSDPAANIRGGAKYLRSIYDSCRKTSITGTNGFWLWPPTTRGQAPLTRQCRWRAKNDEELSWRSVKEAYLYLEGNPGAASRSQVRGKHVVNYVQKIRYYYYVLNGIVVLDRPEAEHLTPLLAGRSTQPGSRI